MESAAVVFSESHPRDESPLVLQGCCPECAGPFSAGVWDHSFHCEFCGSTLIASKEVDEQVFVVSDRSRSMDPIDLLIYRELESARSELAGRTKTKDGLDVEIPIWIDARMRALEDRLRRSLRLVERIDFFAPYEIDEQTIAQGILGRRGDTKESFVQIFLAEELRRDYDPSRFDLRDRGLKIPGMQIVLLSEEHVALATGRFIERQDAHHEPPARELDRSAVRVRSRTDIIARMHRTLWNQRFRVFKHMVAVEIERDGQPEAHLIDGQFGTIAGTLRPGEISSYRSIPERESRAVFPPVDIHAIASECPECGWGIHLPPRERIVFCPTCHRAVEVTPKGLRLIAYQTAMDPEPDPSGEIVCLPFWAFPFRVRTPSHGCFERIWDWLEAVSPQPIARHFAETDPESSLLYLPARRIFGRPELDDAWAQLVGWLGWRQPILSPRRPVPGERRRMLGVELSAQEAMALAPFALVALHDHQSTRRLHARSFCEWIRDVELDLGDAILASIPMALRDDCWRPSKVQLGSTLRGIARDLLEPSAALPIATRTFPLR